MHKIIWVQVLKGTNNLDESFGNFLIWELLFCIFYVLLKWSSLGKVLHKHKWWFLDKTFLIFSDIWMIQALEVIHFFKNKLLRTLNMAVIAHFNDL